MRPGPRCPLATTLSAILLAVLATARANADCPITTYPTNLDATFFCGDPDHQIEPRMRLRWDKVGGATSYQGYYFNPNTNQWVSFGTWTAETGTNPSFQDEDVFYDHDTHQFLYTFMGTNITFKIAAIAAGCLPFEWEVSRTIKVVPIPPNPSGLGKIFVQDHNGQVRLFWGNGIPTNQYALLYRDGEPSPFATVDYNILLYDFPQTDCVAHTYYLVAKTDDCLAPRVPSDPFDESIYSPPAVPVIQYPLNNKTQCLPTDELRWAASCAAESYDVQLATDINFTNKLIDVTGHPTTSISTGTLPPSTNYYWRVQAVNGVGPSGFSATTHYTTGRTPWWPSTTDGVHAVRQIYTSSGGVVTSGSVYWSEHATLELFPEPMDCPCTFAWGPLVGGGPYNYSTSAAGNLVTVHNISVSQTLTLTYQGTPTNSWGTGEIRNWGFSLFAGGRPSGPPGCPYVGVWTEDGYVDENNILAASESPENHGQDVTDWYALEHTPELRDGRYWVRLLEFEHERSQIDQVRVFALDHPVGTRVQVDGDGGVTVFEPVRAMDLGRFRDELQGAGDVVSLEAPGIPEGDSPSKYGIAVKGVAPMKGKETGAVAGGGVELGSFAFRERPTTSLLRLRSNAPARLTFERPGTLSQVEVVRILPGEWPLTETTPVAARHSSLSAALTAALKADRVSFSLSPGEEVEFGVKALPLATGLTRTLVVAVTGRYEKIPSSDGLASGAPASAPALRARSTEAGAVVFTFSAGQAAKARLAVFDLQGREIARIAEVVNPLGIVERTWDASRVPPGIYFARLSDVSGAARVLADTRFVHTR
jgi:hypothetical protein